MEKNLTQLTLEKSALHDHLELAKKVGPDTIAKKERLVTELLRDALAGHMELWPPQTPTGSELVEFADRVIALVPTLDDVKARRQ